MVVGHGELRLEGDDGPVRITARDGEVTLALDELRWLALVAAPVFLSRAPRAGASSGKAGTIGEPDQLTLDGGEGAA